MDVEKKTPKLRLRSVQIQTIDYCNRKCPWCPNKYLNKTPDLLMREEIFFRILSELKKLDYQGAIHPYLMGEPLADKRFKSLVRIIRWQFPTNVILINTNGDFLKSRKDVEELIEAGLSNIIINLYDKRNYHLIRKLEELPEVKFNKISKLRKFYYNRAGLIREADSRRSRHSACPYALRKMCINYLGDVILCCSDYFYQVVFGNVMEMDLWDIYFSERYVCYRQMHAKGMGYLRPLCSECDYIKHPEVSVESGAEETEQIEQAE